jgi:hypothetical protein
MSSEDSYGVAKSSFRLIPNCNTVRYMEVPADLPGVVISCMASMTPGRPMNRLKPGCARGLTSAWIGRI